MTPNHPASPVPAPARQRQRGFSLVEMAIALGIGGILLGGIWQAVGYAGRSVQREMLASQATAVAVAAQSYIKAYTATVLPLTPAIGDVARLRMTDGDSGDNTVPSVQGAGLLPGAWTNQNAFGQVYAFYVRREDAGPAGADGNDRLVGLVLTVGGNAIDDLAGAGLAEAIGAAGGFMYADSNPDEPTAATTASGAAGGWQIDLSSAGWSTIGDVATAGRLALLTNMMSPGASSGAVGKLNDLSDAMTNYPGGNMLVGSEGASLMSGGANTGAGAGALPALTSGVNNAAFGTNAGTNISTGFANTGLGAYALQAVTAQINNTAVGTGALTNNTADDNTAVGVYTMYSNQYGTHNVAVGSSTLSSDSNGSENVAVGFESMAGSNSGSYANTAVGSQTLRYNRASGNVAMGFQALIANTSGGNNTGIGTFALVDNTSGGENTAIGFGALDSNTSGYGNTAIGTSAGNHATSTSELTAIGFRAAWNSYPNSGGVTYNTAIGAYALAGDNDPNNNTGIYNTAVGHGALKAVTSGTYNTAIGGNAMPSNTAGNSNIAIGPGALEAPSNGIGNIGIGAYYDGSFGGALKSIISGDWNIAIGSGALDSLSSGSNNVAAGLAALEYNQGSLNTAIGSGSGRNNNSGGDNTFLGHDADTTGGGNHSNSTALGAYSQITASNQIVLGNSSISEIRAQVTSITAISDARRKRDVAGLDLGLDFIKQLRPVQYRFNNGDKTLRYGFLAQELERALPESSAALVEDAKPGEGLALVSRDADADRTYRVSYGELTAPMVKAMQELDGRMQALQKRIDALEAENAALRAGRP